MTKAIPGVEDLVQEKYTQTPFGKEARKLFQFPDGFRNLNHGSFGTHPRSIQRYRQQLLDLSESAPDAFHRYTVPRLLDTSRLALAQLLNAPVSEIVLVSNLTTAVNTVLRNLKFEDGDGIAFFGGAYGAVEKCVYSVCEVTPAVPVKVQLVHPVVDEELVERFEATVKQFQGRVRVAIFDTLTSMPSYRMPFERLVEACKKLNVLSLVDGAHGAGVVPLNLSALDADFFASNLHKWLFVPRGSAVFHVPQRNQHLIRTSLPTSHGFVPASVFGYAGTSPLPPVSGTGVPSTPFSALFQFVGTLDVTPYLVVSESLRARREMFGGEQAIMQYNCALAEKAGEVLAKKFGTVVLDTPGKTLTKQNSMQNIQLPLLPDDVLASIDKSNSSARVAAAKAVGDWIGEELLTKHDTYVPILWYAEKWWVRISAQIYLEESDFEYVADVLEHLCQRISKGELEPMLKFKFSNVESLAGDLTSTTIED